MLFNLDRIMPAFLRRKEQKETEDRKVSKDLWKDAINALAPSLEWNFNNAGSIWLGDNEEPVLFSLDRARTQAWFARKGYAVEWGNTYIHAYPTRQALPKEVRRGAGYAVYR